MLVSIFWAQLLTDSFLSDYFSKENINNGCFSEDSLFSKIIAKIESFKVLNANVNSKFEEELYKKKYETSNCMIKIYVELSSDDEVKNKKGSNQNQSKKSKNRKKKNKKQNESNEAKINSENNLDEDDEEIQKFKLSLKKNSIHKHLVYKAQPIDFKVDFC